MKRILTTLSQKWPEYLIEAIVIVASILGAYALDNWNEQRQREEKLQALFEKVKNDLAYDLSRLDRTLQYNKHSFLVADSILDRTFSWKSKPSGLLNPSGSNLGISVLTFSKDSYTELMKISETIPKEYYPLINQLNRVFNVYPLRTGSAIGNNGELQSLYLQIIGKLDWHDQLVSGADLNQLAINYYENDPEFRTIYRKYHDVLLTYIIDCYVLAGYNTYLIDEISGITGIPFDWSTLLPAVERSNSEKDMEQYTGTFIRRDSQDTIRIRLENGYPLVVRNINDFNATLYYQSQGQDTLTSYPNISSLIFHRDSTGSVTKLTGRFLRFTGKYQKVIE